MGGGQLALMMAEAAASAGVELTVLAASADDPASAVAAHHLVGSPRDPEMLRRLGDLTEVVTFDHELVDLDLLSRLEATGVVVRPSPRALRFSVDKAYQRTTLAAAGLPVPDFVVANDPDDPSLERFLAAHTHTVVKAATGGYDGRGVFFCHGAAEARDVVARVSPAVVEERLPLDGELAQIVVRSVGGDLLAYPTVSTVQASGMCVETSFPATLAEARRDEAVTLATRIADLSGAIGLLAVELFDVAGRLLVNEVALRPHNTGHWTIEGARTSQFENHLRAVAGHPLGSTDPVAPAAVMVNLVGGAAPARLTVPATPGVVVHDYRKAWRPARKIGHVTALAEDVERARVRAWSQARACGAAPAEVG